MLTLALALSLATAAVPDGAATASAVLDSDPGAAPASIAAPQIAQTQAQPAQAAIAPAAAHEVNGSVSLTNSGNIGIQTNSAGMAAMPGIPGAELSTKGFPTGSMLPLLGLGLVGGLAIAFAKKKQAATSKLLSIVETHNLGGRRQLIVASISGETVLLGSSEAGLSLLLARPGETVEEMKRQVIAQTAIAPAHAPRGSAKNEPQQTLAEKATQKVAAMLGKLRLAGKDEVGLDEELSFEELLEQDALARAQSGSQRRPKIKLEAEPALLRQPIDPDGESAEDLELRRKLPAGRAGRVA